MYYIKCFRDNPKSLHTFILMKKMNNWTYIVAIGYGGGGAFEEFCCKVKLNDNNELEGHYSLIYNPDEWEFSITNSISENEYSDINSEDKFIIEGMNTEVWNDYIFWDEDENDHRINTKYAIKLKSNHYFTSIDWTNSPVDIISRSFWGLSLTF